MACRFESGHRHHSEMTFVCQMTAQARSSRRQRSSFVQTRNRFAGLRVCASNLIDDPKCSNATAQKCPFRHESPPCGAAVMSGVFRFVFLVRRCPICVIHHIYHHAVVQYYIKHYGKQTTDCAHKRKYIRTACFQR